MTCGIYVIINNKNGCKYIGQSQDIEKRWDYHKNMLNKNKHHNMYLQNSWNKYTKDDFSFLIIEKCHKNALNTREQHWIRYHNTYHNKKHYNLTPGGDGGYTSSKQIKTKDTEDEKITPTIQEGYKRSNETRNRMSETLSKVKNTTGYFRVSKHKNKRIKQGFEWTYRYYENGKQKAITSIDLGELKKKVEAKGLEWRKYD